METSSPARRASRQWSLAAWRASPWFPHIWLLPVMLVAIYLRLVGIQNEFLYGDEAEYGIVSRYLSRDATFLAYPAIEGDGPVPFVSQPPLILYVSALFMKIMGPTDLAAIMPSVLFGLATVATVYAIGYRLGGRFPALAAAGLLAILPFHIDMSRRGMLDAGYVFFLTLTAYFLIAWLQTRTRRHAVLTGAATAGACLSKLPGILAVPAVLIIAIAVLAWVAIQHYRGRAEKGELKETAIQVGLGATPVAAGALAYLALLWHLEALGNLWVKLKWQLSRVDTSTAGANELAATTRDVAFYFEHPHFSFKALYGGPVLALAVVGLGFVAWALATQRGRRMETAVVPLFLGIVAAFFFWSDRKEGFYLLPFAPFLVLLCAFAADGVRRLVAWGGVRFTPRLAKRATVVALVAGLAVLLDPAMASAEQSMHDYHEGHSDEQFFGYGTREAAAWIHERDPTAMQYGTLLGRFTLHWYNEHDTLHWYVGQDRIEHSIRSGELKYIVYDRYLNIPQDDALMKSLVNRYSGQKVIEFEKGDWGKVEVYQVRP